MEITNIEEYTYFFIETKDGIDYRRDSDSPIWERRYGESWESVYLDEERQMEAAFQIYVFGR